MTKRKRTLSPGKTNKKLKNSDPGFETPKTELLAVLKKLRKDELVRLVSRDIEGASNMTGVKILRQIYKMDKSIVLGYVLKFKAHEMRKKTMFPKPPSEQLVTHPVLIM
jgi:hypothetical protein